MAFELLLGNDRLKQNLVQSPGQGSHLPFLSAFRPEGSGKHTLARLLAAAILCRSRTPPACTVRCAGR